MIKKLLMIPAKLIVLLINLPFVFLKKIKNKFNFKKKKNGRTLDYAADVDFLKKNNFSIKTLVIKHNTDYDDVTIQAVERDV